jgi:putative ABC transport system permease protein
MSFVYNLLLPVAFLFFIPELLLKYRNRGGWKSTFGERFGRFSKERIKELATLKVLGFYDDEVSAYIYRENVILTFFGIVIGLFAGIFLNLAIVSVIDIDTVTFSTDLKWWSFLLAAFCTILFAVIVNVMMHKKLKKISMVESLKSVE